MKYARIILIAAIICLQIPASQTFAFQDDLIGKVGKSDQPVIVKGDKVEYFHTEKKVTGSGNVSIAYGDVELRCDKIIVYTDTKEAICEGNVRISQPGALMEGDKIHYNFATKKGYALESRVRAKPFYGGAGKVEQKEDKEYELEKGYITTCDLEKPHYRIEAREVQIFLDDKIIAKHILFYVGDAPVLYLPIYVQPLLEKRPEVTVVPGRSSDWGYYALTAWRYYFNENSKGDIHVDYREKKGLAAGIDYRYKAEGLGNGVARFYYTHENDVLTINKSGPTDDRWRFQYRHSIDLPEDNSCTIELNKLSDRDFIKDYLYREYEEDPSPDNYILFETRKPNYTMSLLARKRLNTFLTVVDRLPEAKLEINNQRLWDTNFYYYSQDLATNFIKRYDDALGTSPEESIRLDTYQKISYAAKLFNFLFVTPFAATRQTFYSRNRWGDTGNLRSIYEGGVDLSAKFYKTFDINTDFLDLNLHHLRHIVTPTVGFLNRQQPTISPSNLYQFDEIDNIEKFNGFSMSLENKLQTRRPEGPDGQMKTVDLARLIITTDYLFRLQKKSLKPQGVGKFGDLYFKLEVNPYPWLSINGDMTLDHKDHDINSANIDVNIDLGDKFKLGASQRYESTEDSKTNQFAGELFYNINDDWKVKIYQRFNVAGGRWEEQEYIVQKDLHCWIGEAAFDIRNEDISVWVIFKLKAFPQVPIGLYKTTYYGPRPGLRR